MQTRRVVVLICGVVITAVAVGLYGQNRVAGAVGASAAPAQAGADFPQLTRLQVDVFELKCTNDALAGLDLYALGRGGDQAGPAASRGAPVSEVLARLGQMGSARLAVRFDNFVDLLAGCRLVSGRSIPTVSNVTISAGGVIVPSVTYENVGFIAEVEGRWREGLDNVAEISFSVESSELSKKALDLGAGINLPTFDQFQSKQRCVARTGQPVMLACNSTSVPPDDKGRITVLVVRLVATRFNE